VPDLFSGGGTPSPWLTPLFGVGAVLLARRPGGLVGLIAERWPSRLIAVRPRTPANPELVSMSARTRPQATQVAGVAESDG